MMIYYTRKRGKVKPVFERRHTMKQKVCKAVQVMFTVTMEDLGFFVICGIALFILIKLACV